MQCNKSLNNINTFFDFPFCKEEWLPFFASCKYVIVVLWWGCKEKCTQGRKISLSCVTCLWFKTKTWHHHVHDSPIYSEMAYYVQIFLQLYNYQSYENNVIRTLHIINTIIQRMYISHFYPYMIAYNKMYQEQFNITRHIKWMQWCMQYKCMYIMRFAKGAYFLLMFLHMGTIT